MADGYIGLFRIPDEGVALAVITAPSPTISEVVEGAQGRFGKSRAKISFAAVSVASGNVQSIAVKSRKATIPAINSVFFDASTNPADGDTVTVNSVIYTFKNTMTATGQVKIATGGVRQTALNFLHTINATSGKSGTAYYAGQTANTICKAIIDGVNVTLRALAGGTAGNAYTLAKSSTTITVDYATFFGGLAAESTYKACGQFKCQDSVSSASGWVSGGSNAQDFFINDIPYTRAGALYDFIIDYLNADGQRAVSTGVDETANVVSTSVPAVEFNGLNDLSEYIEVYDLAAENALNKEGTPGGSTLPAGGMLRTTWANMSNYVRLKTQPTAAGTCVDVDEATLANITEYAVYMYIATTASAPGTINATTGAPYPSASEANGTWYLVGKTQNTWIEIQCPKNKLIAIWVGFGTVNTQVTTALPDTKLGIGQY